jgi:hypothetical protein
MKPLVRALALTAVLGFACLSKANGTSVGACRYICGGTIHEVNAGSTCCSQTFTCPDGTRVSPYGYYSPTGWRFC